METNSTKKIVMDASLHYDGPFTAHLVNGTIVTETGMLIPTGTPMTEYQQLARTVCVLGKISQWSIGDIIVAAENDHGEAAVYGSMYPLLANLLGRDEEDPMFQQYIRNIAYVSRNVKKRYANLSWSHHREVASLSKEFQETILEQANAEGMTVKQLSVFAATYKSAFKAIESSIKMDEDVNAPAAKNQPEKKAKQNEALPRIAEAMTRLTTENDFVACAVMIAHHATQKVGMVPPIVVTAVYDAMRESEKHMVEKHIAESHGKLVFNSALDNAINLLQRMNEQELSALHLCIGSEIEYRGQK
jgi:hypothetical protein